MANITKPSGLSNIWAAAGTKIDPGNAKVGLGWVVQLPPYEYQNWVDNRQDAAIAHINQHGIPEWDASTEYQGNLSYTQGSDGMIYKCLVTHTNKDPVNSLNAAFWVLAFETFGSVRVVSNALAAHILNYQTLSAVGNPAAARSNLSLYSKAESDTRFAGLNGSPAQVFSVAPASAPEHAVRLGQVSSLLTQATEATLGVVKLASNGLTEAGVDDLTAITPLKASTVFLKKSGNLAGLTNISTARSNLGLGSAATQPSTAFLNTANNLADIVDGTTARSNLGITSTATRPESYFLRSSNNLSDLTNISTARSNLGLGNSSTRNIGTVVGTVAAGDDSRIVNAVPNTTAITAGNGLTGGGALTGALALALGTPQTLTSTSTNTVSATSHSHGVDILSFFGSNLLEEDGYYTFPGGFILQWGRLAQFSSNNQTRAVTFKIPFPSVCFLASPLGTSGETGELYSTEGMGTVGIPTTTGFTVRSAWGRGSASTIYWIAFGK